MEKDKLIIKILLASTLILALLFSITMCVSKKRISELEQTEKLYSVSQDSLKTTKNKLGEETAKVEVLEAEQNTLFTQLHLKDKDINRLQILVTKYEKENGNLNTAIIISNQTILKLRDSLRAAIIGYTHPIDSPTVSYPIYKRSINKQWYAGTIVMGLDTLDLSLKVKNEYDITIGDEKVSLFKRKSYANITNLNPDTETKVMKVYDKQEKKTKIMKPITVGGVIGLAAGYLLFH